MSTPPVDQKNSCGRRADPNSCHVISDAVGLEALSEIAASLLDLLGTSSAIYEKNGDYALDRISSGWCRLLVQASRGLCATDDNRVAQQSGSWLCHESCWTDASKVAIETGQPVDASCRGGLRLYAVPILAGDEVIGAISLGYGEPPKDSEGLREIADLYRLGLDQLMAEAHAHHSYPQTLIQIVKKSLAASARIMGALVVTQQEVEARVKISQHLIPESKWTEEELGKSEEKNRQLVGSAPTGSDETEGGRLTDYIDFSNAKSLIANDVTCRHNGGMPEKLLALNQGLVGVRAQGNNGGIPEKILALNPMESAARGFWTDITFK